VLVAEAAPATGRPSPISCRRCFAGGKVIVSTGTKTLQDQLYDRDLPAVRRALTSGATPAAAEGRANYVCLYRLRRAVTEGGASTRDEAVQLQRIERFAATTVSGDRADLCRRPRGRADLDAGHFDARQLPRPGCPDYSDCFVMRARRNALAADIVVIKPHLFFADVVLREEGIFQLLPACNTLIFDEAHQLPETARLFFGERISSSQIVELARDARGELRAAGGGSPELEALCNRVEKAARDLRLPSASAHSRLPWPQALAVEGFPEALTKLRSR